MAKKQKARKHDLFIVSYSWYEDYDPTVVKSPKPITEAEFQKICRSLLTEAAEVAIQKENSKDFVSWVGVHEVENELIGLLVKKKGWEIMSLPSFCLWGSNIIEREGDLGETNLFSEKAKQALFAHNKKVEEREEP